MTTKPKAAPSRVFYDMRSPQSVPLKIDGHVVRHNLDPLSDERFYAFEKGVQNAVKRAKKVGTSLYEPKEQLWRELCTGLEGYKERSDWKEATDQAEAVQAINALLHIEILAADETDKEGVYDPEAPKTVEFKTAYAGVLMTLSHSFRPDSKKERDEFMAIETDAPNENNLASLNSMTKSEQLAALGRRLLVASDGYADGSDVPAWHLAGTTESFFARQIAKMGKSLEM